MYLRSFRQYPGSSDIQAPDYDHLAYIPEEFYETRNTGVGTMKAIKHASAIEGCEVG